MIWDPQSMLLYDVYKPFGSLHKAGLRSIGRTGDRLIMRFVDGTERAIEPGEKIPLPEPPEGNAVRFSANPESRANGEEHDSEQV